MVLLAAFAMPVCRSWAARSFVCPFSGVRMYSRWNMKWKACTNTDKTFSHPWQERYVWMQSLWEPMTLNPPLIHPGTKINFPPPSWHRKKQSYHQCPSEFLAQGQDNCHGQMEPPKLSNMVRGSLRFIVTMSKYIIKEKVTILILSVCDRKWSVAYATLIHAGLREEALAANLAPTVRQRVE